MIVLLDRDGTINVDHGYVYSPERLELIPGAANAIGDLVRAGHECIVVSNQSAIGRGMCSVEDVESTNKALKSLLVSEDADAVLADIRYSPDAPGEASMTRKPETGMISDLIKSQQPLVMVGDKLTDIEFGAAAGAKKNFLVLTGKGAEIEQEVIRRFPQTLVANNLMEASRKILSE